MPLQVRDGSTWKDVTAAFEQKVYDSGTGTWRNLVSLKVMEVTGDGTIESPYVYTWRTVGSFGAPTATPNTPSASARAVCLVDVTDIQDTGGYWRQVLAENITDPGGGQTYWLAPGGGTTHTFTFDSSRVGEQIRVRVRFSYVSGGLVGPASSYSATVTLTDQN